MPTEEAEEHARNTSHLHFTWCSPVLVKTLQRVLQAGEKQPLAAPGKSSFPVHLAGSLEQIHSRCQPHGAPPLVVLPPAAAHTLLLLIVRRRQQRALFWTVCGCPRSGNCVTIVFVMVDGFGNEHSINSFSCFFFFFNIPSSLLPPPWAVPNALSR